MKPALLTLSFLLFAFPLAFSNDAQQVLDDEGNPVVPGTEYFIVPIILGPPYPGAVTIGNSGSNPTCPATVEVNSNLPYGIPVKFSIPEESNSEILTDTPVEIEFTKKPDCIESSKWRVFGGSVRAYVGIGGPQDHPGTQNIIGRFSITKSSPGYSFEFCRSPVCANVGRYFLDGPQSLLVLTGEKGSFQFVLKKAYTHSGIRTVV